MPNQELKDESTGPKTADELVSFFFKYHMIGAGVLLLMFLLAIVIPMFYADLTSKVLTTRLTFLGLALLFSMLQVFLGVLLALIGVSIDYKINAKVGSATLKLASASPGILLIVAGNLLFGFSLMREMTVTQSELMTPEGILRVLMGNTKADEEKDTEDRESTPGFKGTLGDETQEIPPSKGWNPGMDEKEKKGLIENQ